MSDKIILVGMPCGFGYVPTQMVQSILQMKKPTPCAFMVVDRQRIDKARNAMVHEALKNNCDYLFMVDDDNPIPQDTLEKFLEDDKDIVIAPILARNPAEDGTHKLCAFYSEEREIKGEKLRLYHNITGFRDDGYLHKIDAGGTGCMLIKRKVLEAMVKKHEYPFEFGDITVGGQRRTMSEDCQFCERAVDMGFEIWLDERVRPYHMTNARAVQWTPVFSG